MNCVLGIDTSCYTTSVAIMDENGRLLADARKLLTVKIGSRGLSQSEMVFQHTRNLPALIEEACAQFNTAVTFKTIGVSAYPRPLPDSYMPAFLVGVGFARGLAVVNKISVKQVSHQEGHIFAGIWSAGGPMTDCFLAIHMSGGTTEVVKVSRSGSTAAIELLGGTQDLNAGQMIDRVGVMLGLPFPAGPHLEKLANANTMEPAVIPSAVKELMVSFSGPETHAMRLIKSGASAEAIAEGVQLCISTSLAKVIRSAVNRTGLKEILLVGGVASNQYIRDQISQKLTDLKVELFFPARQYSSDNAVGAAFMAVLS
ncbi:tRNA N6-adenosine threonylcarbamoyltransferase [bioreactor metagenome]|uniref:N(6)-L-threonylcarbamoyladenine synthase n=1 Tax=bioreactor metagenome TaxID=1076179 RepID=A0A644UZ54_9ZZZZ